jgi:GMP synthase-like glutamine amidotransferase
MRVHYLHAPFEGPGNIAPWVHDMGYGLEGTNLWLGDALPRLDDFDWLVVLGGPMNVYEEGKHPWLAAEKRLIWAAVRGGKSILGVCLGAQLISAALGGEVSLNPHREIGWHRVALTEGGSKSRVFGPMPSEFTPMHWHSDTFTIPEGCVRTAESRACKNQAFECCAGRVVGLQFHLEYSAKDVEAMVREMRRRAFGRRICTVSRGDTRRLSEPGLGEGHIVRAPGGYVLFITTDS